jgi:hypothetical protein
MQSPANEGVQAGVVDMVEVSRGKVDVMPLPTEDVNEADDGEHRNTRGRRPNVERIAEKEVLMAKVRSNSPQRTYSYRPIHTYASQR